MIDVIDGSSPPWSVVHAFNSIIPKRFSFAKNKNGLLVVYDCVTFM